MALDLNKDGGEKKKFNLTKTPEVLTSKPEETIKNDATESNPKKSNKGLWIVIGILVIVGGIWFVTSKSSDDTSTAVDENNQAGIAAPVSDTVASSPSITATTTNNPKDKKITNFAAGSANLIRVSNNLVKEISDFVSKNPNSKITINGYASSEGDLNVNQKLSQKRAEKVRDYLIKKGIPAGQLEAIGKGIENPIGDNNTLEGKMQNRRIEVVY